MSGPALPEALRGTAFALAVGAAGAAAASVAGVPAPFITGPAIAVTVAGLAGMRAEVHPGLRNAAFVVIGFIMGAGVTPQVMATAAAWPLSFVLLAASVAAVMWAGARLLRRLFGHDRTTATLAASPGHLSFVMSLGVETGGNLPTIGIVQSIRLLCLTLAVPFVVSGFGGAGVPAAASPAPPASLATLAAVLAVAWLAGFVFNRLRLPAGFLIGAMAVSTAAHITGAVEGGAPLWLAIPAYVFMGALIGSRFSGIRLAELRSHAAAGLMTTMIAVVIALAFAFLAAVLTGLPLGQVLIAFAPGGVETMSAMALQMHVDPAYVAAHHVLRLFILTALVPLFLHGGGPGRS